MKDRDSSCNDRCREFQDLLEPWVEGELTEIAVARLRRHAAGCAPCAADLGLARQVREGLRELPRLACPPRVVRRVEEALKAPQGRGPASARPWYLALAAALGTLVVGGALVLRSPAPRADAAELARAEREARMALTLLDAINQRAAVALRDDILAERIVEPPGRAVNRIVEGR